MHRKRMPSLIIALMVFKLFTFCVVADQSVHFHKKVH